MIRLVASERWTWRGLSGCPVVRYQDLIWLRIMSPATVIYHLLRYTDIWPTSRPTLNMYIFKYLVRCRPVCWLSMSAEGVSNFTYKKLSKREFIEVGKLFRILLYKNCVQLSSIKVWCEGARGRGGEVGGISIWEVYCGRSIQVQSVYVRYGY